MIKAFKAVAVVLAAVILVVGGYVAYVFLSFHRLGDMTIEVNKNADAEVEEIYVSEGDEVEEGQALFVYSTTKYELPQAHRPS